MFFDISSLADKFYYVSRLIYNDFHHLHHKSLFELTTSVTFKTLMIICILSDTIPQSFYVSVYQFYPAICKSVSLLQLPFTSPIDVVSDFPKLFPSCFCHMSNQENVSKQTVTEYDVIRSCLRHMELRSYMIKETQ